MIIHSHEYSYIQIKAYKYSCGKDWLWHHKCLMNKYCSDTSIWWTFMNIDIVNMQICLDLVQPIRRWGWTWLSQGLMVFMRWEWWYQLAAALVWNIPSQSTLFCFLQPSQRTVNHSWKDKRKENLQRYCHSNVSEDNK